MKKALHFARTLVNELLPPGGIAIDATAGNGHDTVFLAQCVGPQGKVFAFDIQQQALEQTSARLAEAHLETRVQCIHAGHEAMQDHIPSDLQGRINVIMFNLGYLPHGDKHITTQPATTLSALHTAIRLLAPAGLITIMMYPGHAAGAEEALQIATWSQTLPQSEFQVLRYELLNLRNSPPILIAIERSHILA